MKALPVTGTAAERPRLYRVPPVGLSLAERAEARRQAAGQRTTWSFPGYDADTPGRAAFNAGIAYGVWGAGDYLAGVLAELAGHLTTHAMHVIHAPQYGVTAMLTHCEATISVLALRGRAVDVIDPGIHRGIQDLAHSWGSLQLAAGPAVYGTRTLPAVAPIR
ncbi:hypothetical protein ACFXKW_20965 [Streptomyces sp. NPDC059193]|uniref:hypothetical protein n=1 Tax=Streptomyces sp. NPDC059193 TaxID=3346763 RepID=UPI0036901D8A